MKKKFVWLMMTSFVFANFSAGSILAAEDLSALASQEGEQVKAEGDKITIEQKLSDEAKRLEKKRLKKKKKAELKLAKKEARAARQIRKDQRIKEKALAKQEAKLERKKKEWQWKQNR